MSSFKRITVLMSVPVATIIAAGASRCLLAQAEAKRVGAKKVPLESIYSTNGQKGLKAVDRGQGEGYRHELDELYRRSKVGASNVFLTRGEDIAAAVKATWRVFAARHPVDQPVGPDQRSKSDQFWLVAYFGVAGSDPPAWLVGSVEIKGNDVRLVFKKAVSETTDEHQYFAWIPLGRLEPGTYTVELFDEDQGKGTFLRRVTIPKE